MKFIEVTPGEYVNVEAIQSVEMINESLYGRPVKNYIIMRLPWEVKTVFEHESKGEVVKKLHKIIKEINGEK